MSFVNEAGWDRLARLVVGLVMVYLGWFAMDGLWGAAFKVFALIPLVTAAVGWDPFYAVFGVATRRPRRPRGS